MSGVPIELRRAATLIEKFLDANHPCSCTAEEQCPGNSDEAYSLAQDVIKAMRGELE